MKRKEANRIESLMNKLMNSREDELKATPTCRQKISSKHIMSHKKINKIRHPYEK